MQYLNSYLFLVIINTFKKLFDDGLMMTELWPDRVFKWLFLNTNQAYTQAFGHVWTQSVLYLFKYSVSVTSYAFNIILEFSDLFFQCV